MSSLRPAAALFSAITILHAEDYAARYREQLNGLDATRPESVCAARSDLREWMPRADMEGRAAMFRGYRRFYLESAQTTSARFEGATRLVSGKILARIGESATAESARALESDVEIWRAVGPWIECGLGIGQGEGMVFPAPDPGALVEFAARLPADLAAYVRFREKEDAQTIGGDGALALSWDELRMRLGRWEEFAWRYPRLVETESEVRPAIRILAGFYFFGEDNTWTFDGQTGRIKADLIASWKRFEAVDRRSYYHGLAGAALGRLAEGDGRFAEKDRALFEPFWLGEEFERWWKYWRAQTGR